MSKCLFNEWLEMEEIDWYKRSLGVKMNGTWRKTGYWEWERERNVRPTPRFLVCVPTRVEEYCHFLWQEAAEEYIFCVLLVLFVKPRVRTSSSLFPLAGSGCPLCWCPAEDRGSGAQNRVTHGSSSLLKDLNGLHSHDIRYTRGQRNG